MQELVDAGAKIFLCRGPKARGSFRCKAVVVDRGCLYTGSPNATQKFHSNEEFCFRITGPPVGQVLQRLSVHLERGNP